jgi:cytochrome P450
MPRRPPGPSAAAALAIAFGRSRLDVVRRLAERYGDVVFVRFPGTPPLAILNHPDYVRDVLVTRHRQFHKGVGLERAKPLLGEGLLTSEGEFHARQRRLLLPAFHRDVIHAYATTMAEHARRRSDGWQGREEVDVAREMAALALSIAGRTLFGADVDRDASTIGSALTAVLASFDLALMPFGHLLIRYRHLPIPAARRFMRAKADLDAIIYRLIAERRAGAGTGSDVLSLLVSARDVDGDNTGMTDEQIRDEALTLLLAGHETTANALTWTWYLLSAHPEVEERLHAELAAVLGDRLPTAGDVPHLPYTRAVLSESMRLFPPAYLLGRRALVPYDVPGTEYVLPAGTVVLVAQILLHRDSRFWDDAERFHPERWLETPHPARHRYAYFPFGAGPRVCIGEHFAWMEATLILATIASRWRLRLAADQRVEPQPIMTLRARYGMRMAIERRGIMLL